MATEERRSRLCSDAVLMLGLIRATRLALRLLRIAQGRRTASGGMLHSVGQDEDTGAVLAVHSAWDA